GRDAVSACHPNPYGYATDVTFGRRPPIEELDEALDRFDVFNLHFGHGFFGQNLADHDLIKRAGKHINLFLHGCDVRHAKTVIAKHRFSGCQSCWPVACNANARALRAWAERHADRVLVSTPDLIEFVSGAEWLPQAIDLDASALKSVVSNLE